MNTNSVAALFDAGSPLEGRLDGFAVRSGQREMAELVLDAIESRHHLAVEAGAGTGKTLAYLIPALLSGARVIITTATRTLQDQLYLRDLPLLTEALGRPARTALLKGRANYLCVYRFERLAAYTADLAAKERKHLHTIQDWAGKTRSGDVAEVNGVPEESSLWERVTSTADNCLGGRCPEFDRCHVVAARKKAADAELAVVNHHLLVADLTLRGDGFGSLLPGAEAVIVDEAHRFPDVVAGLFDIDLGAREIESCIEEIRREAAEAGIADAVLQANLGDVARSVAGVTGELGVAAEPVALARVPAAFMTALGGLGEGLAALEATIGELREASPGVARCADRVVSLSASAARLAQWQEASDLCWAQADARGFSVHLTPLDAARQTAELLGGQDCSWIFTSATLAVDGDFSHFLGRLGLDDVVTREIPSPYDFDACARIYLPRGLPAPEAPGYTAAVVEAVRPVLAMSGGRAFMLFTSHRALRQAAELLREKEPDLHLLVQGTAPRSRLLEQFARESRAVLLGTATFWEGVDIPGPALVVVSIDRLPFASPGDPYLQARLELIRRQGGDPFRDFQLPQAVLTLRQGVGRLIRGQGDYGVVVLCDPRLRSRSYGRIFLRSLPPMRVTDSLEEVGRFLAAQEGVAA